MMENKIRILAALLMANGLAYIASIAPALILPNTLIFVVFIYKLYYRLPKTT